MFVDMFRAIQFIYSIVNFIAAMNAAIQMVTVMDSVDESAGSVQVCAAITGVTGMLECNVTNTPTLTGSAKAGMANTSPSSLYINLNILP